VQRELGGTLYALGRMDGARAAFEAVIAVDPTDFAAYQYLAPIYAASGLAAEAEQARKLSEQWRDDPLAAKIGTRFFSLNPQWADERTSTHIHDLNSTRRPVLTGKQAAPVD
jgi:predicted Zn-dependent protease